MENSTVTNLRRMAAQFLAGLLLMAMTGCAYMHTQRPLSVNFNKTELGTKEGRANSYSILWLFSWGNAGTKAAADNGQIKTIECADAEIKLVLFGLYTRVTTVVYGE